MSNNDESALHCHITTLYTRCPAVDSGGLATGGLYGMDITTIEAIQEVLSALPNVRLGDYGNIPISAARAVCRAAAQGSAWERSNVEGWEHAAPNMVKAAAHTIAIMRAPSALRELLNEVDRLREQINTPPRDRIPNDDPHCHITTLYTEDRRTWHILQREGGSASLFYTYPGMGLHYIVYDTLDKQPPNEGAQQVLDRLRAMHSAIGALLPVATTDEVRA